MKQNELRHWKYKKKIPAPGGGYYYVYDDASTRNVRDYSDKRYHSQGKTYRGTENGVDRYVKKETIHTNALFGRTEKQELVTNMDENANATEITEVETRVYGQLDRLGWKMETAIEDAFAKSQKQISKGMKAVSKWFKKIF